jgi:hypothetical protein
MDSSFSILRKWIYDPLHGVLVAHTYNPNYSGGSDQEDGSSKPA